jgi:HEAT repeat protein
VNNLNGVPIVAGELGNKLLRALSDSSADPRKILATMEKTQSVEEIRAFALEARTLDASVCVDLCSVLASATTAPLIDLLGEYAGRDEAPVRAEALKALGQVPGPLAAPDLRGLLRCTHADSREAACRLLGAWGAPEDGAELVRLLEDPTPEVALAALEALERLRCAGVAPSVVSLMEHPRDDLRQRAVEALVALADDREFPGRRIRALIARDPSPKVRGACVWALGKRPSSSGCQALLQALRMDADEDVQCAAAAALAAHRRKEVARALLDTALQVPEETPLEQGCRRTLHAFGEEIALPVCRVRFDAAATPETRAGIARLLGKLSFPGSARVLEDWLRRQTDPVVRAVLVELLGKGMQADSWRILQEATREGGMVGRSAMKSMAEHLDSDHLEKFAETLAQVSDRKSREIVLNRLCAYGRRHGLTAGVRPALVSLLHGDDSTLAVLAAEACGWIDAPQETVQAMLPVLETTSNDDLVRTVGLSAMKLSGLSAYQLLQTVGKANLRLARRILEISFRVGTDRSAACRLLAAWAAEGVPEASEALEAVGRVEPAALVAGLLGTSGAVEESLLTAWAKLGPVLRDKASVDWPSLLQLPSPRGRATALETLTPGAAVRLLPTVVDMVLRDKDPTVRECAKQVVKRVIESSV